MQQSIQSSTPDGLAPLSSFDLTIIISTISVISILYSIFCLVKLARTQSSDNLLTKQTEALESINSKVLWGSLQYVKFNIIVGLVVAIVPYLLILIIIEQFDTFEISTVYALGVVLGLVNCLYVAVVSAGSYKKIIYEAKSNITDGFRTAMRCSAAITYMVLGMALASLIGLFIYFQPSVQSSLPQISHFSSIFLFFSFGYLTITLTTKLTSTIYFKGSQSSFQLFKLFSISSSFLSDIHNPMLISKCIGENINKSVSKVMDYVGVGLVVVVIGAMAAGLNVIGTDQDGEIVFKQSYQNTYTAILIVAIAVFFSILAAVAQIIQISSAQDVKKSFRLKLIVIVVFLVGFIALGCYLTLPAEFKIKTQQDRGYYNNNNNNNNINNKFNNSISNSINNSINNNINNNINNITSTNSPIQSPLFPYLIMIISLFLVIILLFISSLISSSPYFLYSLLSSCSSGPATCLISGLSMGYFSIILNIVTLSGLCYLCYFWLNVVGISMGVIGVAAFLPYMMNVAGYYSVVNTASMIAYITKCDQQTISNLIQLNESKNYYQPKLFNYNHIITIIISYAMTILFVQHVEKLDVAISEHYVFMGLLIGSMYIYLLSGLLIQIGYNVAPIMCYEIQQHSENNSITSDNNKTSQLRQMSFSNSNHVYLVNIMIQLMKVIPLIFIPFLLNLIFPSQLLIGLMIGLSLSSFMLSVSNSMSGLIWGNLKDQISYNKIKHEDNNDIPINSEESIAAEVGKNVGANLKDVIGQVNYVVIWWVLVGCHLWLSDKQE